MVKIYTPRKAGVPIRFNKEPERNSFCLCGSGKKYKNCHLGNFEGLIKLFTEKNQDNGGK